MATSLLNYLSADIRVDTLVEIELLILTFATGIQDATTFPDFHCFASNQTGNTVILAIAVAGVTSQFFSIPNIGISLGMFLAGSMVLGQAGNTIGSKKRIWLLFSIMVQIAMVLAAAALQFAYRGRGDGSYALGVIALLAFASGAQVAMARATQLAEISTAMATAAWVDLLIDPDLVMWQNRSRNRRALFLASLVTGSFAGAFMYARVGSALALLISAVVKFTVMVSFFFNRREEKTAAQGCA